MIAINAIYIDVLFLVNLIINICLIVCTGSVLKLPCKVLRVSGASAVGALYSCLVFIGDFGALTSVAMRVAFALLIILTAFGMCKIRQLIKRALVFFGLTVGLGVCTLALLYFTDMGIKLGGVVKNGIFYFNIPIWFMLTACVGAYIAITLIQKLMKKSTARSYARITLSHLGRTVELKALVDTGNMLSDPFTGRKVLIAEANVLSPLFDFNTEERFKEGFEDLPEGFRLIPFSSIGKENGLLAAFVPDKVSVESAEKDNIITAVFTGNLSQSGDYNALIGPTD